jgi:3-hydroxyisobutyrate dehydrogenase
MSQGSSTPQAAARCVGVIGLGAMGAGMAQSLRRVRLCLRLGVFFRRF